jgi:hypothetical protein
MSEHSIYTTGGTVQAGSGIYLPRQADEDLLALCQQGALSYVLTPRQMGKSSLMINTANRLREEGRHCAIVDLQALGTDCTTAEEWYLGFLVVIEPYLELETNVVQWWQQHTHLGFTQRMTLFFEQVLLAEVLEQVIIFVDEIDSTLSLDFTDDFFAVIRYLFLARAEQEALHRLSFVLIGVATPGDLIRDPQRTPFNVGQRVDLTDFTWSEALPLAAGLGVSGVQAEGVMKEVLDWTGGHPYLTQRLCGALVEAGDLSVEQVVHKTFFGQMSEQDSNLQLVRDMLTKKSPDIFETLTIYQAVRRNRLLVEDEEQSIIKSHLKLSGIVKREGKSLKIRNVIYKTVFDDRWINSHLPINWRKRLQRAAFALIGVILFSSVPLAGYGLWQADLARKNANNANEQASFAQKNAEDAETQRQVASMNEQEAKKQTALAQKNLVEANRQRQIAINNEQEAKKQATLAQENAKATEQQRQIAINNEQEAKKQATLAQENAKATEQQRQVALMNEQEAKKQATLAQENAKATEQQRQIAINNEQEAKKQATLAQENAKATEQQRQIALMNEQEAKKQATLAQQNSVKAEQQRQIAFKNEQEAKKQTALAQQNLVEAEQQRQIAFKNEQEAIKQAALAQKNAEDAEKQRKIAIKNEREAIKQTALAKTSLSAQLLSARALELRNVVPQISLLLAIESHKLTVLKKTEIRLLRQFKSEVQRLGVFP